MLPNTFTLSDRTVILVEDGEDALMEVRMLRTGYRFSLRLHPDGTIEVKFTKFPAFWNGQASAVAGMQARYAALVKNGRGTPYHICRQALSHAVVKNDK